MHRCGICASHRSKCARVCVSELLPSFFNSSLIGTKPTSSQYLLKCGSEGVLEAGNRKEVAAGEGKCQSLGGGGGAGTQELSDNFS